MNIWNQKAKDCLTVSFDGRNTTTGQTTNRTVGELLHEARARGGVFGPDNQPVSAEMTVADLTNWHADYNWRLA